MSGPTAASMSTTTDKFKGVCYAEAVPTPPELAMSITASNPQQDSVDDCDERTPAWYCAASGGDPYVKPATFNNDAGPTRKLDRDYARSTYDACLSDARSSLDRCVASKEYDADRTCENTPTRAGRDVNLRPIKPGEEKACADRWVYGTDVTSVSDTGMDGTNASDSHSKATQVAAKVGGGIKFKVGGAEANLAAEGSGSVTWTDQATTGTSRADAHAEQHTQAARPGTAEDCNVQYRAEKQKCGIRP